MRGTILIPNGPQKEQFLKTKHIIGRSIVGGGH